MSQVILITGGSTGGHLFPGIAIADIFKKIDPLLNIVFVSVGREIENYSLTKAGYFLEIIDTVSLRGSNLWNYFRLLLVLPNAINRALKIISKYQPRCVISVGSYAAFPLGIAAWMKGVPLFVQEQNVIPGLTNRILGYLAQIVFTSFINSSKYFSRKKIKFTGNPVRSEILTQAVRSEKYRSHIKKKFEF